MDLKEIIRPNRKKIAVFLVLIAIVIFAPLMTACVGCYTSYTGFPLVFQKQVMYPPEMREVSFNDLNFVIDLIVLYLISCIVVYLFPGKNKKRK